MTVIKSSVAVQSTGSLALALRCACCRIRRQAHMGRVLFRRRTRWRVRHTTSRHSAPPFDVQTLDLHLAHGIRQRSIISEGVLPLSTLVPPKCHVAAIVNELGLRHLHPPTRAPVHPAAPRPVTPSPSQSVTSPGPPPSPPPPSSRTVVVPCRARVHHPAATTGRHAIFTMCLCLFLW